MRRRGNIFGYMILITGAVIMLSLVLPSTVWWFLFGAMLVCIGIKIICF